MQFVVTYGDSVHFAVTTTDSVEAVIHAFSTTSLDITLEGIGGVTATQVTIAGFAPEVTLHIAVDDLRNDTVFTADAAGVYSFTQDLTVPRHVMIKPFAGTWYLGNAGWTPHSGHVPGTWDPVTKTATLTEDVTETIQVEGTGVTLDGAGHSVTTNDYSGVKMYYGANNTLQNVTVSGTYSGIEVWYGSNHTLQSLAASGKNDGVIVRYGSDHTLQNLSASGGTGISLSHGSNHTLQSLTASGTHYSVHTSNGSHHRLQDLTASGARIGILVPSGSNLSLQNLTASGTDHGIYVGGLPNAGGNLTLQNVTASGARYAIAVMSIDDCQITGSTFTSRDYPLAIFNNRSTVYNNNFISGTGKKPMVYGSGHVMSLPAPTGGNYWNTWCPPAHPDNDGDGFVDSPYSLGSGFYDWLPYATPGGWATAPLAIEAPVDAGYVCAGEVPAASPEQATVTGGQGTPTVAVSEVSNEGAGTEAEPLILTRTWTATDEAQQTASASQTVTVVDESAPEIVVPANVSVTAGPGVEPCDSVRIAVAYGMATATDACGEPVVAVSGVPEGGFRVGMTTLTWTATDAVGNATSGEQTVTVSCPVGTIAGLASQTCDGVTSASAGATVRLLHETVPFSDVATGADGGYAFDEVRLGTYTVQVVPPEGYGVPIDTRLATLVSEETPLDVEPPFVFTCLLGDIAGTVEGTCSGSTAGLHGVTVDLYRQDGQGLDVLVASVGTDAAGSFRFDNLALGEYSLSLVKPLGYTAAGAATAVSLTEPDGLVEVPAMGLTCQPIVNQVRGMGYWKHQVNVYLTGKGKAQETLGDLLGYIDLMVEHFNQNLVNPVIVYVPGSDNTNDRLLQLQQLLTVNKGGTALDRAKQHLLPLLLNVVAAKISQTEVISDNGATVSQAITYCHDLIVDGITGNDETAKTIAEKINEGQRVPSGMVPVSTRQITYNLTPAVEEAHTFGLGGIHPNPARGAFTVEFSLAGSGAAWLEVVDVSGRQVLRQEVGRLGAGRHTLASGDLSRLSAGVYFLRLSEAGQIVHRRVAVIR